jgi:L-threonylcarbamoyladenylate synthase
MSIITKNIDLAIACLREEDIVAIPTETVYGLAGSALNDNAIKKIFAMKNRPVNHPLIMHIAKDWDLTNWALTVPDYVYTLIDAFWPGPLTIVLNSKPGAISPLITGGQNTVAIRCPAHPIAESLLTALDFPLVAPSANPFGKISPTTAAHVLHSFRDESLLILDGGRCPVGIESTIVNATNPEAYQILRHGMIDEQAIQVIVPQNQRASLSTIRVPGKLDTHYQPEKPLYCFEKQDLTEFCRSNTSIYVLSFHKNTDFNAFPGYQLPDSPDELAYELYHQLRRADQSSAPIIAMELPPDDERWKGIRERLLKAATK